MKKMLALVLTLAFVLCTVPALSESDVVQIHYLYSSDSFDPVTDLTRQIILEELNVDIIPEMYSSSDQITMILASKQEYDAVKITDSSLLTTYVDAGIVTDLTDLVKADESFYARFPQEIWDMVTVNDRIYAIPESDTQDVEWGIAVRKDWLDLCSLEIPTTVEEFYDMLVAFSQIDPANVGVTNIIPFSASGSNTTLSINGLTQAFGMGGNMQEFVDVDGSLVAGLQTEGGDDFVAFLNKLYAEKLLDADFPSNTNGDVVTAMSAGNVGCAVLCCWDSWCRDSLLGTFPDAELVYIGALTNDAFETEGRIFSRGGLKNYLVVPSISEKAEAVVQYCKDFLDESHYMRLILGDEGVHYEINDGVIYPVFPGFNDMNKGRWFYPTNVGDQYTPLFSVRAHKEVSMGYLWDSLQNAANGHVYMDTSKYCPLLPAFSQYYSPLASLCNEYLVKMIVSADELAKYDDFVTMWLNAGGEQWTIEMNEWYATTK